ncbi:hypothetical protein SESBI_08542 [Sesbania bispinosa]|nr:hypothetical protein SESBI_08542 [Sesbania bispinosa]
MNKGRYHYFLDSEVLEFENDIDEEIPPDIGANIIGWDEVLDQRIKEIVNMAQTDEMLKCNPLDVKQLACNHHYTAQEKLISKLCDWLPKVFPYPLQLVEVEDDDQRLELAGGVIPHLNNQIMGVGDNLTQIAHNTNNGSKREIQKLNLINCSQGGDMHDEGLQRQNHLRSCFNIDFEDLCEVPVTEVNDAGEINHLARVERISCKKKRGRGRAKKKLQQAQTLQQKWDLMVVV